MNVKIKNMCMTRNGFSEEVVDSIKTEEVLDEESGTIEQNSFIKRTGNYSHKKGNVFSQLFIRWYWMGGRQDGVTAKVHQHAKL